MKIVKTIIFAAAVLFTITSCRKEAAIGNVANIPGLGGDTWTQTSIDKWLYDSLVTPYNIDVLYKWNQFTVNQIGKNVVPADEKVVVPVMDAILRVWANPYKSELGALFLKQHAPKFFVLSGSAAYSPDGSAILGVAGGGRQINLLQLNYYKNKDSIGYTLKDTIQDKEIFLTVHHEFSHIFDQLKRRPNAFDKITQNGYSSDWLNITDDDGNQKGFVTAYASSAAAEDFAEMISHMLVLGKPNWDDFVANIGTFDAFGNFSTNDVAQQALKDKEQAIVDYFKYTWKLDFYSLQKKVRAAVEKEFY